MIKTTKVDMGIPLHTLPTIAVGIAAGWSAAFGLTSTSLVECVIYTTSSLVAIIGFIVIWHRREKRQHGGEYGGRQSKLEAWVPTVVGLFAYLISTAAFWKWPQ